MRLVSVGLLLCFRGLAFATDLDPTRATSWTEAELAVAGELRDRALRGTDAYGFVQSICDEVGARPAGTAKELEAVEWSRRAMQRIGLSNVRTEAFTVPGWERGLERATLLSPHHHELVITTLGHSVPTPEQGIEAEVAYFPNIDALIAAPLGSLEGKIAFVGQRTLATQDGSGYGFSVRARRSGPSEAARRGAIGYLLRSIATHEFRVANTGALSYLPDVPKIPAAALSPPDAEMLERLAQRGPLRVRLVSRPKLSRTATSHNVIGDLIGRERPNEYVILSAHLDSWDLGTGAVDDGAGMGIVLAAAKLLAELPERPRRSIRVIFFGAEEVGLLGARAYVERHAERLHEYYIGSEADAGGDLPYAFRTRIDAAALPIFDPLFALLAPLNVARGDNLATGGPDMTPFRERGVPVFEVRQDVYRYFDVHHTPNDNLTQIDAAKLDQNVAVWAPAAWLMGNLRAALRLDTTTTPTP